VNLLTKFAGTPPVGSPSMLAAPHLYASNSLAMRFRAGKKRPERSLGSIILAIDRACPYTGLLLVLAR
jgi:hypothetical protein